MSLQTTICGENKSNSFNLNLLEEEEDGEDDEDDDEVWTQFLQVLNIRLLLWMAGSVVMMINGS